jgi:hypothetical protein
VPEKFQHILRIMNTNIDGRKNIMFAMTAIKVLINLRFCVDIRFSICIYKCTRSYLFMYKGPSCLQSVPITTNVVSSTPAQDEVYHIM